MFLNPRERRVNLGGKSKTESRDELLRRARQERQQRQDFARASAAATTIQSWWRGVVDLNRARREFWSDWQSDGVACASTIATGQLTRLVANFAYLFNPKDDEHVRALINVLGCVLEIASAEQTPESGGNGSPSRDPQLGRLDVLEAIALDAIDVALRFLAVRIDDVLPVLLPALASPSPGRVDSNAMAIDDDKDESRSSPLRGPAPSAATMALRAIAKLTWPGTWEADAGVVSAEGGPSSPVRPLAAVMARAAEGRWGPGRPRVSSLFLLGRCMAAAAPRLAAAGHRDATGRSGACAGSPIEALCATVLSRTLTTGAASAGAKGGRGSLPGSTHPPLFRDDCPTVWRSSAFRAGVAALACVPGLPDVCPTLLKMAPLCAELLRALVPPEGSLIARAGKLRPVALRNLVSIASAALPAIAGRMRESASAVEERVERAAARSGSDARASMETREERERHEALCWSCVGVGAGLCVAAVELGWGGAGREEADAGAGGWDGARECEGGLGDLVAVADPLSEICLWPVGVAGGGSGADVAIADHGAALQLCEALVAAVMARSPAARGPLVRHLAFGTRLVSLLWASYLSPCQRHPSAAAEASAHPVARARKDDALMLPSLLLCLAFSPRLVILSEKSLRSSGAPIAPADLFRAPEGTGPELGLVPLLREVLTQAVWGNAHGGRLKDGPEDAASLQGAVQEACATVYAQLFARHLRAPLAPGASFHSSKIAGDHLVREAVHMAQSDDYEDSDEDDPGPSSSGRPCLGALPWRPVVLRPDGTVSAEGHSGKRGEGVREGPGRHGVTASVLPHATGGAAGAGVAEGAAEGASPGGRVWKVLRRAPYLVEFRVRARAFQDVVSKDRAMHQNNWVGPLGENRFVKVRRDHLIEDAFDGMDVHGVALRRRIRVQFVDQYGMAEAGVDGGGLFKDFLESLMKEAFGPDSGLFSSTADHRVYPTPLGRSAWERRDHLRLLGFLGRMTGKAVYEGILMELPLAGFLLKKFRGEECDLEDLPSLDPELHRNLTFLLEHRASGGDVADLSLTFCLEEEVAGTKKTVDLVPGGRDVQVDNSNVLLYIHAVADWKLNKQCKRECEALVGGFFEVIDRRWIAMFAGPELQMLISGIETEGGWDVDDLRRNVTYAGGYADDHPVIQNFWQVVSSFGPSDQSALLKFVTACSRPPLLGFRYLEPAMGIQMAGHVGETDAEGRLPTAATCMNLLKLPPYPTVRQMRDKLLYAIHSGVGFDLS